MAERLTAELVAELTASGQFSELHPGPASADLSVVVELSQVSAATGMTLIWYLMTGGFLPVRFPYEYTLEARALRLPGREREYIVSDRASVIVWEPGSPGRIAADVLAMDPTSSRIRRNLYRTLIRRMYDEGMLEPPCAQAGLRIGLHADGVPCQMEARYHRSRRNSMAGHGVISADSHMMEPADLWLERLDRRFRDRSPKVIRNPDPDAPTFLFVAEGAPPFPVAGGFAAGRSGKELAEFMKEGYEAARPSGWDPVERVKDQELDGVDAEILYPTLGMTVFTMSDAELQRACFTAYNDWLAEFCRHDPKRLYGIGLISLESLDSAVEDVERIAKQGMQGAMIWGSPPEGRPYSDRAYDPFWRVASELRLPVSLHIITGRGRQATRLGDAMKKWGAKGMLNPGVTYTTVIHEIQESLATLVFGGVFERFPELRIVSAENDIGWLPHIMYRMDHAYDKYRVMMPEPLSMRPSEYVRRQVWATFQDDAVGAATYQLFGEDNYMWASDFPHTDSTFPESHAWIEKNFQGVPAAVRHKMVYANAASLYRMKLD